MDGDQTVGQDQQEEEGDCINLLMYVIYTGSAFYNVINMNTLLG